MASSRAFSLSDFDYHLPESLIAQKPADPRDHSRLLVYNRSDRSITDDFFYNLPRYLPEHSVLVINNSRVEKARLLFGKKEVFITRVLDPHTVEAMIRPGRSFRVGHTVELSPEFSGLPELPGSSETHDSPKWVNPSESPDLTEFPGPSETPDSQKLDIPSEAGGLKKFTNHSENPGSTVPIRAEVLGISDDGLRTLRFNYPINDPVFEPFRRTPFPPYIRPDESLSDRYQTVYAKDDGSKAAPTAGLHFTDRIFEALSRKSVGVVELTLHVGLGTFAPVKTEKICEHKMHSEWYRIIEEAAERLRHARHITAVGTTSARVLESAAGKPGHAAPNPSSDWADSADGSLPSISGNTVDTANSRSVPFRNFKTCEGETDIFITPGYRFQTVDSLITNFHLPKSTLLMMIAAFTGIDEMHRIYRHAIQEKYRFYSFGDAMLLQ